jgi:hypothetical protein
MVAAYFVEICETLERAPRVSATPAKAGSGVPVHLEVGVGGKERHPASRIATIGAMRVGLNEFPNRETIRRLAGRDRQMLAHDSDSLRLKYGAGFFGKTFGTFTDLL